MHSPALAIAWELWCRNRWGIGLLVSALLLLSAACLLLPQGAVREPIFPLSVILFAVGFLYVMSMFLYCEFREGTLSSGFPRRMFTLPVRSSLLVACPMLYGTAALALLWVMTALLIWLPVGIEPAWWLLPLLAVGLAWMQAVCWAVPGSSLTKVIAACIVVPALKYSLEMVAMAVVYFVDPSTGYHRADFIGSRPVIITVFSACFLPLAYVVAVLGVARDRVGMQLGFAQSGRLIKHVWCWLPHLREPFSSAARAQLWFEWRSKGFILPLFAACFLLFVAVVVAPFLGPRQLLSALLILVGLVPLVAFFVGYGLGKTSFWARDLRLSSWHATRPLSSGALATAKLNTAALSALASWLLLFLVTPLWLILVGRFDDVSRVLAERLQPFSAWQVVALAVVGFLGLCGLTWGQLVAGLGLSIMGRTWVVNGAMGFYLVLVTAVVLVGRWVYAHPNDSATVFAALSWLMGGLAILKVLGFGWAFHALGHRKLLEWRSLGTALGLWLLAACCLVTLAYGLLPAQGLPVSANVGQSINRVPIHLIALGAILSLPLVRLTAAPLGLAWNRIR